jgi:branched-chain amino acid transport system ATP-binding protein
MGNWLHDPELRVQHLTMRFGGLTAIGDLSFDVGRKEITALIGPNGAGKTTVFNCITGFYKPTEGMIQLRHPDGKEFLLERMDDYIITRTAKVARTFQNIRLFSGMTVLENLMVAQHNKLMKASGFTISGIFGSRTYRNAEAAAVEQAKYWLEKVGLIDRADDAAGDLPYGAQRRLEIARAMCTEPRLLCLDEPAAGLNPRESEELNKLLLSIKNDHNMAILLIEHDMSVVMGISDHIVVLDYGRKISDGTPQHVKNDPAVIRAYLGVEDEEDALEAAVVKPLPVALALPKIATAFAQKTVTKKPAAKKTVAPIVKPAVKAKAIVKAKAVVKTKPVVKAKQAVKAKPAAKKGGRK